MKIVLLSIQSNKEPWFEEMAESYAKKIRHLHSFEYILLKSVKTGRDQQDFKREEESQKLLTALNAEDLVYLFDEKGRSLDSLQFSKKLEMDFMSSSKRIVFIVGGAFGVNETVKRRANQLVSLSPFVLNHLVAQTVVFEQLYRALAIQKNLPYHNI